MKCEDANNKNAKFIVHNYHGSFWEGEGRRKKNKRKKEREQGRKDGERKRKRVTGKGRRRSQAIIPLVYAVTVM